jgi:nicotinamidase-related amidase
MELENVQSAVDQAAELLDRARSAGTPVIHIMHAVGAGSPYDVHDTIGQIVDRVAPWDGEPVIVKNFPNAFTATDLDERLAPGSNLVLAGFMTHMCVNSTARGAFSLGHHPAIVASATATRALPGTDGSVVPAAALQAASLAAVADLFGIVVAKPADIPP